MARWTPIPHAGGAYSDDTKPWSCQDTANYIPVKAERAGGRSMEKLVGAPGMVLFSNISPYPIRGLHDVEGLLLAVSGVNLVRVQSDGSFTDLGVIPGTSRVSMAHNQITGGSEVMIANGQSGYVYNTVTGVLTQVADEGFPGLKIADFVDGYIAGIEPQGRYWLHSELTAATSYNTLDRYDAESAPDKLTSLIVSHREVLVLGKRSGEFFRNTGAATGTFQRSDGTEMEVGGASTFCAARLDNTVYFLGSDGILYRLDGHTPMRVSTGPVEQAISRCDISKAFVFTFEDRGHKIVYVTLPDGHTWGYDVWTGEFHRRQSKGLDRWRVNALVKWNGRWIAGDYATGKLYQLDWAVQHEAGEELERRRTMGALHDDENPLRLNALKLVFDTGREEGTVDFEPPEPPSVTITITGEFPDTMLGETYSSGPLGVSGGFAPYSWTVTALPIGLSMSGGVVSGVSSAIGSIAFDVTATDRYGNSATSAQSINVAYSSGLAVGSTSAALNVHSGDTSAFPVAQAISGSGQVQDITTSADGLYMGTGVDSSAYFRLYKRNVAGAYVAVATPLDVAPAATVTSVSLTADAAYLALTTSALLKIYKRSGDTFTQLYSISTAQDSCKFSPSGEYLAVCGGASPNLRVYRRSGDTFTSIFTGGAGDGSGLAWKADSSGFAFAMDNNGVEIYSVSGAVVTMISSSSPTTMGTNRLRWSGDQQYLYIKGNNAPFFKVFQWSGATLTAVANPAVMPNGAIAQLDLSADGRVLAVASGSATILYAASAGTLTQITPVGTTHVPSCVHFLHSSDFPT